MTARQYALHYQARPEPVPCLADTLEAALEEGRQRNGSQVLGDLVRVTDGAGLEVWPRDEAGELAAAELEADQLEADARQAAGLPTGLEAYAGAVLSREECGAVLEQLDTLLGVPHDAAGPGSLDLSPELLDKLRIAAGDLYTPNG